MLFIALLMPYLAASGELLQKKLCCNCCTLHSKCIPILLYGLEACPLRKADLNVLDFVVNRFFMKLFRTNNISKQAFIEVVIKIAE